MRVLHVLPSFVPAYRYGGPIRALHKMCASLVKQGVDITVFTTNIDGPYNLDVPLGREVLLDGVKVFYHGIERPRSYSFSTSLYKALKNSIGDFDLVHIHSLFNWPSTTAMYLSRGSGVRYIIRPAGMLDNRVIHHSYEGFCAYASQYVKKSAYLGFVDRRNLMGASLVHYTCASEAEVSREAVPFLRKGFVIPLGVDLKEISADLNEIPEDMAEIKKRGKKIIVFMSRLDPKKGLDKLVAAISSLKEKRNDFVFLVIGSGEPDFESGFERMVRLHKISDITVRKGFLGGERWRYLKGSDLFVLPSYSENFGLAVVEAMACKIPVIISDRVGICAEINSNNAGLIVDGGHSKLVSSMEKLLDDASLCNTLSDNAMKLVEEKFNWQVIGQRLKQVYNSIIRY